MTASTAPAETPLRQAWPPGWRAQAGGLAARSVTSLCKAASRPRGSTRPSRRRLSGFVTNPHESCGLGVTQTVCHIITKLELGGAQQNTLFTVSHLDPDKFRPMLIAGEPGLLDDDARMLAGVELHQIPSLVREIRPLADLRAPLARSRG